MNVTYLIGNGFDLGIGLKTGFTHFLEYYLAIESDDVDINDFKDTIKEDTIELWADLELCFGKYIENFDDSDVSSYIKIYEDILKNLSDYLKVENEKMIDRFEDDIIKKFKEDIMLYDTKSIGFRPTILDNLRLTNYYNYTTDVRYNFIVFNYTTTFDKMLKIISQNNNGILYDGTNKTYKRTIGNTLHIHGQLDSNMIFGVNDEYQLPFSDDLSDNIKRRIIKPLKNTRIGQNNNIYCETLIDQSDIICIYGMSIGETDKIWWQKIGRWLVNDTKRRLIYFVHDSNINDQLPYGIDLVLDAEEKYFNKFIVTANIQDNHIDSIRDRLIVVINSNIFQANLISKEKHNEETGSEVTI